MRRELSPARPQELRVLQIPGDHAYVHRITPDAFRFAGSPVEVPSPALTPQWLHRHRTEFDLVHLHFGFEHLSDAELGRWIECLRQLAVPLVLTVHDLRNPHQESPDAHDRHLDLLIPAAAEVLTLTAGAAAEIHRRWHRRAHVVAHPAVFGLDLLRQTAQAREGKVVGIHFKDLRRNIVEPDQVVAAALRGADAAGGRLRVDIHPGVRHQPDLQLTRSLADQGRLDLVVHDRFSDAELAGYLRDLDVYVLPNRFGTHSGWLEACRDMGTRVVAPSCGFYADQWDEVVTYQHDEAVGLVPESLATAVQQALLCDPVAPAHPQFRDRQRILVQARHTEVYLRARSLRPVAEVRSHDYGLAVEAAG